jgi:foldase protein PrsA
MMALCAFFVVAVAMAGCGSGVAGNAVVNVAGNPISTKAFNHWMYVYAVFQSTQQPGTPVLVPDPPAYSKCIGTIRAALPTANRLPDTRLKQDCDGIYRQLRDLTLDNLIREYWYQAYAHQQKVNVTDAQVQQTFQRAKQAQFRTEAEFQRYLATSGQTLQDIYYNIRLNQILRALVTKQAGNVTPAQIQAFYTQHQSQFGQPETRDFRIVLAKNQGNANAALSALQHGGNWNAVAKQYSTDATTKNRGGLISGAQKGRQDAALDQAAFSAPKGKLVGPIKGQFGYYVIQVTKVTPGSQQSLAKATPQIKAFLTQQGQSGAKQKLDTLIKKKYQPQTKCRSGFSMLDCDGFKAPKTSTTTAPGGTAAPGGAAPGGTATPPPTTTTR